MGLELIILAVAAVAAIVSATVGVIQAFSPPKPSKLSFGFVGDTGGSPRYGTFGPLDNTVSNELAVPVLYGKLKLAGNVIWQSEPGDTQYRIVGLAEGQINTIIDVRANDVPINDTDTPNSSVTTYLGTTTQEADSRLPANIRPDMNLRNLSYLALTLTASDKLKGGNPTITCIAQGLLVETWDGSTWVTTKSYSRNPAACIRDFLMSARYGLGIAKANIDSASFGSVYDYCETPVAGIGALTPDNADSFIGHFDGPDGAVVTEDGSFKGKILTMNGNAQIDTSKYVFGGSSLYLDGVNSYVSVPDDEDFHYGGGDFTIEWQLQLDGTSALHMRVWSQYTGGSENDNLFLSVAPSGKMTVYVEVGGQPIINITGTTALTVDGKFHHVAFVRSGNNIYLFVDGIKEASTTVSQAMPSGAFTNLLGATQSGSGIIEFFKGWIDEFRISKVARYTTNFDVDVDRMARFRLDYVIDTQRPAQDVLNDMLATFGGFLVYAGSSVKLRIEKTENVTQFFGDGSTTKANGTYDPGNIVKDSMSWNFASIDDRPNRIRVQWVDPAQNYVKVYTQIEDRIDQDARGTIITKDVSLLGITRAMQASRMAKLQMAVTKYAKIQISFSARLESVHCEVGDVVAVTHQAARFTRKLFRISQMQEGEDETIRFSCREYNPYIFDDSLGQIMTYNQPSGPNLYAALSDVTGLTVAEENFLQKDGVFATNIAVNWTAIPPDELLRLDRHLIQLSSDGGTTYRDVAFASSQKTAYRIVLGDVQTGTEFTVRVKTISDRGAESAGATASLTITGKRTPPANVEDFGVTFAFDHIAMSWSSIDDEDLFGYEIRVGNSNSTWETATIVTTETLGTRYDMFNFTTGAKKFFIKAIDNSGNYSEVAASDSITITGLPNSNVVFTFDLWSRVTRPNHPQIGSFSSDLGMVPVNDYNPAYNRLALMPNTNLTWAERLAAGGTWAALQASSFVWGREQFVTTEESYTTDVIDIGTLTTGAFILDIQGYSSDNLGFISIQISTSSDNITWTSFKVFTAGQYSARYVKFKFLIQATDDDTRVRLSAATLTVDVPDIDQTFLNQSVDASGTTVNLTGFTSVQSVVITTVGSSGLTPEITDQSGLPNSFTFRLFDIAGVSQAGSANIYVKGY